MRPRERPAWVRFKASLDPEVEPDGAARVGPGRIVVATGAGHRPPGGARVAAGAARRRPATQTAPDVSKRHSDHRRESRRRPGQHELPDAKPTPNTHSR